MVMRIRKIEAMIKPYIPLCLVANITFFITLQVVGGESFSAVDFVSPPDREIKETRLSSKG